MSSDTLPITDLTFDSVSKRYLVRRETDTSDGLHPWLRKLRSLRLPQENFWALRDVSFEVKRGEVLGLIGHNGAGKSTILKLLSGITTPTSGRIVINGRLSALIEVGSGFHPELTGRENIFLNGAILGMRRAEISEKLDRIVDFAGVRAFLDVPVKRFSSGMYVRLGFSIAAHLDPDILLLDEVLAVGDAAFQEKCLRRIGDLKRSNTTIVFISHDLAAVERICDRVVLLRRGEIAADGLPREVLREYEREVWSPSEAPSGAQGNNSAISTSLTLVSAPGDSVGTAHTGAPLSARLQYDVAHTVSDCVFEVVLYSPDNSSYCQLTSEISGGRIDLAPSTGHIDFHCQEVALQPGLYYADVTVKSRGELQPLHSHPRAAVLRVDPGKITHGNFYQPHSWTHVVEREK